MKSFQYHQENLVRQKKSKKNNTLSTKSQSKQKKSRKKKTTPKLSDPTRSIQSLQIKHIQKTPATGSSLILQQSTFNELVLLIAQLCNKENYQFAFKFSVRLLSENPNYSPLIMIALKSCNKLGKYHEVVIIASQYLAEFNINKRKTSAKAQLFRANAFMYLKMLDKSERDLKELILNKKCDKTIKDSAKKMLKKVYQHKIEAL